MVRLRLRQSITYCPKSYSEEVFYATGAHPRYSGTPSAYRNTRSGRYDYRYDGFDRLVGADYSSERDGEDFSTEYVYDEIGRPTSVKRWGVVDFDGKDEVFGVADATAIEYEGAMPRQYGGDPDIVEGSNFYGRTGIGTQCGSFMFDAAGRLALESINRIKIKHEYNASGRTMAIRRSKLKSSDGSTLTQTHDCRGTMLSRMVTQTRASVTDTLVDRRYVGPFTFSGDTLVRVDFAGGFFDSHGYPNYMLPDRLGSVDMVVNFYGFIEQHNGYYPYGEPWREPKGNHLLFAGKERLRHIVRDSDFGPRALNTALCLWNATDLKGDSYAHHSPFVFCGSNPIKHKEINGNEYYTFDEMGRLENIQRNGNDIVAVHKKDGSFVESMEMPLGTIEKHQKIRLRPEHGYADVWRIRGDAYGTEIFELLAEHTNVEYTLMKCGLSGDRGLNFLTSSQTVDREAGADALINGQLRFGYTMREHIHNHPSGRNSISPADHEMSIFVQKIFNDLKQFLFTSTDSGNSYYKYDEKSPISTPLPLYDY